MESERGERRSRPRLEILLVEDEPTIAQTLYETLGEEGHVVTLSHDGEQAMARLDAQVFDLVITDVRLPGPSGMEIFARLRREAPSTRVVLMSAYGTIADAVRALKENAAHYFAKPFDLHELLAVVEHLAEELASTGDLVRAAHEAEGAGDDPQLIGRTPELTAIKRSVAVIAPSQASVLIVGAPGTGKQLVARTIHTRSALGDRPFLVVRCAGRPEAELEAELFGSSAVAPFRIERRTGVLFEARGGTLYLEEVWALSSTVQARLLQALEDGTGGSPDGEVRVLASTSVELAPRVEQGLFRADLYYRLKVFELRLPLLFDRRPDLPLLVEHLYRRAGGRCPERLPLTPRAFAALNQHRFPGNVRELRHAIEHAVLLAGDQPIDLEHLPGDLRRPELPRGERESSPSSLPAAVREFEREYLLRTLTSVRGQKQRAADMLGISRKTLWVKLRQYGIHDFDNVD